MQSRYRSVAESLRFSPVSRMAGMAALMLAGSLLAGACGSTATAPTTPAALSEAPGTTTSEPFTGAGAPNLTPQDFAAHGWECRPSPVPGRVVCSNPGEGFPTVPPAPDRPATFTFLAWENGTFAGTLILIRTDLYQGQPCESTSQPYILRALIGYYECLHTAGQ